jgi:hypothetical protein
MEAASSAAQSLQAADVKSPEELSASNGVGATLGAMMGDQSPGKARSKFIVSVPQVQFGSA